MSTRLLVVVAEPTGDARWHVAIPSYASLVTRTLATGRTSIGRRVQGAFDLQVRLGGLEDLCADAVDLGQRSDAATVAAMRLRRRMALALTAAGIRRTDVAYLMGIASRSVAHLLAVPVDSAWMTAGQAPPTAFPRRRKELARTDRTHQMTVVIVTREGTGWDVQMDVGRRSTGRTSLVHAEKLAREMAGDADVILCPQLPEELEKTLRESDLASAAAQDLQLQAYDLRLARRPSPTSPRHRLHRHRRTPRHPSTSGPTPARMTPGPLRDALLRACACVSMTTIDVGR